MRNTFVILASGIWIGVLVAPAQATTLTASLAAWQAGVGSAPVTATGTSGAFDTTQPMLPTTNVIPLLDGSSLALANFDQVQQPTDGNGGYPFSLNTGYMGDVFSPETTGGAPLMSETITLSNGQTALGFYVLPNSSNAQSATSTITATLSDGTQTVFSLANASNGVATPAFVGFFGGGESSLTISTSDTNGFAFGSFVDVPEPGSVVLLLSGVVFSRLGSRRRSVAA